MRIRNIKRNKIMRVINNIFTSVFDWFKSGSEINNPTQQNTRRPATRDWTDSLVVNAELTRGLFHNSYPGLKLAGAMAYTPIAVPVWFMGLPIPEVRNDESTMKLIEDILKENARKFSQIHLQCHREGTIWIYPFYSSKKNKVVLEFIPDEIVSDIIKDIYTGEIIQIITDEQIKLSIGYNQTANVKRRRYFTINKVETKWSGDRLPVQLRDSVQRNVSGTIPIPFSNNSDGDETRGHSDYERIVTDLKDYHDIDLKRSETLARFNVKMVQSGTDFEEWKKTNGITNMSDFDIVSRDFIYNRYEEEKTEFLYPEKAHDSYDAALKNKFRKLVEGSGIPEILWGTKVEGNKASAKDQMDILIKFVREKQSQKTKQYKKLFEIIIMLERKANIMPDSEIDIDIKWNELDAISEDVKAEIIKNFAQACSFLIAKASATKEMIYKLWQNMLPGVAPETYEIYKEGISETAKHNQFVGLDYEVGIAMTGEELDDKNEDDFKNEDDDFVNDDNNKPKENIKEQPLNIILNEADPAEVNVNVPDIIVPEIKVPDIIVPEIKQPDIIINMEKKKKKTILLKRDKDNNIIGAEIEEENN